MRYRVLAVVAVLLAAFAGVAAFGLLRPTPARTTTGTIVSRSQTGEDTYSRHPPRPGSADTRVRIASAYHFQIRLDGSAETAEASLNQLAGRKFTVGQRVRIEYRETGLWPFWTRITVLDMHPG